MTRPRAAKRCVRCLGNWRFGINWPEGYVCRSCITRAVKIWGRCPGCGADRLLVGRDDDARPICVDCAGISTCFRCDQCGNEGGTWYSRTCVSCSLARRLRTVMDDGTGEVALALVPLFDRLCAMPNPMAPMTWLNKPAVRQRLASLAQGTTPLTHAGVDTLTGSQAREFLRELLVEVGLLPGRDKYLAAFESWTHHRLTTIDDAAAAGEIERYLSWRQARVLRIRAAAGRLPAQAANTARDQTDAAVRFLGFLRLERGHSLGDLTQADVDEWFSTASNPQGARDFIIFAIKRRRCPRVEIPERARQSSTGSAPERLATITHTLLTDETIDLADRVAGLLVVLLAQPFSRICALETHHVVEEGGRTRSQHRGRSVPDPRCAGHPPAPPHRPSTEHRHHLPVPGRPPGGTSHRSHALPAAQPTRHHAPRTARRLQSTRRRGPIGDRGPGHRVLPRGLGQTLSARWNRVGNLRRAEDG